VLVIPGLTDADSNLDANSNLKGHSRSVYSVSWSVGLGGENRETGNGKGKYLGWLASAGGDGSIMVWELEVSNGLGLGFLTSFWGFLFPFSFSCFLVLRSFSPPNPNSVSVRIWLLVISFFTFHLSLSLSSTAPPDAWRVLCFPHACTSCAQLTLSSIPSIPSWTPVSPKPLYPQIYRKLGMRWGLGYIIFDGSMGRSLKWGRLVSLVLCTINYHREMTRWSLILYVCPIVHGRLFSPIRFPINHG